MLVNFYSMNEDRNSVNKTIPTIAPLSRDLNIPNDVNVHEFDAVITKEGFNYNYAYIGYLHRYYHVEVTHINAAQYRAHFTCDYAKTFADVIENIETNVIRSESAFNGYLSDGQLQTYAYEQIVCKQFPNSMNDDSIILMTIG